MEFLKKVLGSSKNKPPPVRKHVNDDNPIYDVDTLEKFDTLLDSLRPTYKCVEATFIYEGENDCKVGAIIYTDGKLKHVIDPEEDRDIKSFKKEVDALIKEFKKPVRAWRGCRGTVARHLGVIVDKEFNFWFDGFLNSKRRHH